MSSRLLTLLGKVFKVAHQVFRISLDVLLLHLLDLKVTIDTLIHDRKLMNGVFGNGISYLSLIEARQNLTTGDGLLFRRILDEG